ncbi:MAG: hypothetical protein ACAH11_07905 [Sphingomonas sp.]
MRDLWRLLFAAPLMLIAPQAAAQTDYVGPVRAIAETCSVTHSVAGHLLSITRYPADPAREWAYVNIAQEGNNGHNLWLSWGSDTLMGGSPTGSLQVSADLAAGAPEKTPVALRVQMVGGGRTFAFPKTLAIAGGGTRDNVTMIDWATVDRFFAGVDDARLVLVSGDRELFALPLSLDELRRTLGLIPQMRTAAAGLMADPAKDCRVSNPSPTMSNHDSHHYFDCDERWTDDRGDFGVSANRVDWSIDLGDHVQLEFNYDARFPDKRDLARDGFPPHDRAAPRITVNFARRLPWGEGIGIANYEGRTEHHWIGGEIRVGAVNYQRWLSWGSSFTIDWSEWPRLMQGEGDISVAAFDVRKGEIVRKTLPRDILTRVEAGMKTAQLVVREKEWAPATRCNLYFAEITSTEGPRIPGVAIPRRKRRR